jgi:uncharacterized protein
MRVAVTGSTGLIGMALCRHLTREGHQVVRVVRRPLGSNEPSVLWDPSTGDIDAEGLEGIDAAVHLAGESIGAKRWSPAQKQAIKRSRTDGTALLARTLAGLDRKPSVFLSGSAIGYYGDAGDRVVDEESPAGDLFLSEICAAWEAAAQPAIDAGIRTAFLRTGIVLDPNEGALNRLLPLFRLGLGGKMGSGRQWMSWITIDDEVAAITWLLEHDVAGPVNLVAPNPVTNGELAKTLARVLGRPAFVPVPSFGPKLLLGGELAHELLFASQRVAPAVLEAEGFPFQHRELEDGLRHVLKR